MIEKPTVFVLGAGASSAFGFPLGRVLRDRITASLEFNKPIFNAIRLYYGYKPAAVGRGWVETDTTRHKSHRVIEKETEAFRVALQNTPPSISIDTFLENRSEFEELGKVAIATSLMPHEKKSSLRHKNEIWADVLFSKLNTNPMDFDKNRVKIITFNYDRSAEYYLWVTFIHTYGLTEKEAADLLRTIPIVHIHGQLGKPHFLAKDGRDYMSDVNRDSLRMAVDNMRIIYEQPDESPELQLAHEFIAQAEILCFLGFGYHPENMRRLAIKKHFRGKRLLGTCYEMEDNERRIVGNEFSYVENRNEGLVTISPTERHYFYTALGKRDEDAYIFLRRYKVFDR